MEREGVCLFWSDVFEEMVAFIADEVSRDQVPAGIVCYTVGELGKLFGVNGETLSESSLKLIHQAKKYGGHITDHRIEGAGEA